jgi:hypothetical protein
MILSWFDARPAKAFGASLAVFFIEKTPTSDRIEEKKFAAKTQKTLEQIAEQIARFKLENKLNTYKKAQLGNAFKWALKDAGFAPDYVDQLTKWLMLQIF